MLTTTSGSEQRAYGYNGDGTLVAQTANGATTRFTHDLVAPLSQILETTQGTTTKSYVYGHERLYEQAGIVKTWYGGDALGSVRQTLDDRRLAQHSLALAQRAGESPVVLTGLLPACVTLTSFRRSSSSRWAIFRLCAVRQMASKIARHRVPPSYSVRTLHM